MKQKKIIVVATDEEYDAIKKFTNIPIIKTGIGSSNVIEALKEVNKKDCLLINIGCAGSNNIQRGVIVQVKNSCIYHPNVEYKEPIYKLDGTIDCYSSADFVLSTQITEPVVFDMELNTICALGYNVKAYKIVTDNLSYKEYENFDLNEKFKEILKGIED